MTFSIATWNINSVRLRIDLVTRYLAEHRPDVLCLQETKCPDANFPFAAFRDAGYPHIAINGQKGYHGVAVVSRFPFATSAKRDFCAKGDARHLHVVLGDEAQGLELHNFYVPAGGDEPDPEINAKFAHKLAFVDEMADWGRDERPAAGRSILVGDLNIAPLEHDVWSHKQLLSVVSHTPIECEKLLRGRPRCNRCRGRSTGRRRTRGGASTTSGSARRSPTPSSRCASCATPAAGRAPPTMRR